MRSIGVSYNLVQLLQSLPEEIKKELKKLAHDHLFPNTLLTVRCSNDLWGSKTELNPIRENNKTSLAREWTSIDDFWSLILNLKPEKTPCVLVDELENEIERLKKLKSEIKKLCE